MRAAPALLAIVLLVGCHGYWRWLSPRGRDCLGGCTRRECSVCMDGTSTFRRCRALCRDRALYCGKTCPDVVWEPQGPNACKLVGRADICCSSTADCRPACEQNGRCRCARNECVM